MMNKLENVSAECRAENTADTQETPMDNAATLDADQDVDDGVPDAFAVKDEDTANWLVRKVTEARAYHIRVGDWCRREQNRARRTEEFLVGRYGGQLSHWVAGRLAEVGGRRKSVYLPSGTVGFRTDPSRLVVENDQAVLAWAREHCPAAVQVTERLSKSAILEHVHRTGEVPEHGVALQPSVEKFYIR